MVEAGNSQPRTLANAFQKPVSKTNQQILENSYRVLASHLEDIDQMYGKTNDRRYAAIGPTGVFKSALDESQLKSVPKIAEWAAKKITAEQNMETIIIPVDATFMSFGAP